MPTITQEALILCALQTGYRLTPQIALRRFGCFRLGARIFNLRKQGYDIKRRLITIKNPSGFVRVAEYWIDLAKS